MTIRECYDELGLDFDAVLSRLVNEKLVQKFALKFLDDPSFQNLKDALDSKDVETAFRAAHTLKGVCLNLGFDNLYPSSKDLTELLRAGSMDGYEDLFAEVEKEYNRICEALRKVAREKLKGCRILVRSPFLSCHASEGSCQWQVL